MPLIDKLTSQSFHLFLYAGQMGTVTLLKRGNDQREGTVTAYTLYECILPGTEIEGDVTSASKSWYSGEVVEVKCSVTDTLLTTTINHPILTSRGFVPAGGLVPGDNLVCDYNGVDKSTYDEENRPSLIEDIFESFTLLPHEETLKRPVILDLHGDGGFLKGYIQIVSPIWSLLVDYIPQGSESISNNIFNGGNLSTPSFGDQFMVFDRVTSSLESSFKVGVSSHPLLQRHPSVFSCFGFTPCPKSDTIIHKNFSDNGSFHSKNSSKRCDTLTRSITSDDLLTANRFLCETPSIPHFARFGSVPQLHPSLLEMVSDVRTSPTRNSRDLVGGLPRDVEFNKVVNIRRFHYEGPVYNVETPFGYYTASAMGGKIYVKNCRRSNYTKEGEPLQGDLAVGSATSWQIPATQLRRVGVNYINVLDRIIDQLNMWWQPEAGQDILLSQFDSHYWIRCLRVDPSPNAVQLGIPEWTQFPFTNP